MRLLWRSEWEDVPAYSDVIDGVILAVEATVPLILIRDAGGRVLRNPLRKVLFFVLSDGPLSTYRKARAKMREPRFSEGYHVVLALGHDERTDCRVVALACRSPQCADYIIVHKQLTLEVGPDFDRESLARSARALKVKAELLEQLCRERYLYSNNLPPLELVDLLRRAVEESRTSGVEIHADAGIIRPGGRAGPPSTLIRVHPGGKKGIPVALLGAGGYPRAEIIPALSREFARFVVADREPQIAAICAREGGFQFATTNALEAIAELPREGIVFVATAHDSHATLAAEGLRMGHRVFLEKPAVVTEDDLDQLLGAIASSGCIPEVGFNRRYNRLVRQARQLLADERGPATITCVVREVTIQPDHWYFWPNQGTRVAGNLCHWIDIAVFLLGEGRTPTMVSVSAAVGNARHEIDENRSVTVAFDDGSVATLITTGRGDDTRGVQELIDVRRGDISLTIDDLWRMSWTRGGHMRRTRTIFRDKGHRRMYNEAVGRFAGGLPSPYPVDDLIVVSAIQVATTGLVSGGGQRENVQARVEALRKRLQSAMVGVPCP